MTTVTAHRKPRRIQRRRSKGWRMPATAVYVGRGTPYGNGHKIGDRDENGNPMDRAAVVAAYADALNCARPETLATIRHNLAGRDLACWCRLDQECHADLLLALANSDDPGGDLIERLPEGVADASGGGE